MIDERLEAADAAVKATLRETEEHIRHEPIKAVLYAALAGYLMRMLPMRAILSGVARLLLSAVQPTLLIMGAAKAWDACRQSPSQEQTELPFH